MAQILEIQQKIKSSPTMLASLEDFAYVRGAHVEAEIIPRNPCISLYCVDDEQRQAIFVQTPESVDLTSAPFTIRRNTRTRSVCWRSRTTRCTASRRCSPQATCRWC